MNVELTGTVHLIGALETISDRFSKKELVVNIDEETTYPQQISTQCANAKIDLLNGINHGEKVKVTCNLNGRSSNGKYYNQLNVWKIEKL